MKRIPATLAGVMLVVLGSGSSAFGEVVPFEISKSGHLVTRARINGQAHSTALIDSGATFPIIDEATAAQAGISPPNGSERVQVLGLIGNESFETVEVDEVTLGEFQLRRFRAAYNARFDIPGAPNVLPAGLMPRRVLDFDFDRRTLRAYDRKPTFSENETVSRHPIQWLGGLPFIDVEMNGQKGLALVDTGANVSFVNSVFAEQAAVSPSAFETVELVGLNGEVLPFRTLQSERFQFGKFKIDRYRVIVADPDLVKAFELDGRPVMVLGLDILKEFRIQIDRGANQLYFSKQSSGVRITPS